MHEPFVITAKDFLDLKDQVTQLHTMFVGNGFRGQIDKIEKELASNTKLTLDIDKRLAVREGCDDRKEKAWNLNLTKIRTWATIVGFLGAANAPELFRAIKGLFSG